MNETELRLECLKLAQQGLSQAGLSKPRTVHHTEILQYAKILLEWAKSENEPEILSDYAEITASQRRTRNAESIK